MGLKITDAAKLIGNGYKMTEIAELKAILEQHPDNDNDIIELAKKVNYSDLKLAINLFDGDAGSQDQNTHEEDKPDKNTDDNNEEKGSSASDQGQDDNVDYKKLYEDEKQLREKLQKENQSKDISGKDKDNRSDWDIALSFANDVLN